MNAHLLEVGDYVEHDLAPHTVWQVIAMEPYSARGGQARLRWVGGNKITYELRLRILNVYQGGDVAFIARLEPANPMLVIALEAL